MKIRKSLMLAGLMGVGILPTQSLAQVYVCMACAAGTYSDGTKTNCAPCPGLKWAPAGSGSCQNCGTNVASCDPINGNTITCNSGYVKSGNSCIVPSCSAGTYWNGSTCSPCSAGNYCSGGNYGVQTPCPAGQYQNAAGQSGCNSCWFDTYSTGGASNCATCPSGSYLEQGWSRCSSNWGDAFVRYNSPGSYNGTFSTGKYQVTMSGGRGGGGGGITCMVSSSGTKSGGWGGNGEEKGRHFIITNNNTPYTATVGRQGNGGSAGNCQGGCSTGGASGGATSLSIPSVDTTTARGGNGGGVCCPSGGPCQSAGNLGNSTIGYVHLYRLQQP